MSDTISITKENALKAYKQADDAGKQWLTTLMPELGTESKKKKGKITERIKTFEDAVQELGITVDEKRLTEGSKDEIAYLKLKIVARALNEGWRPDWNNENEYKYYPYFDMRSTSGFAFSLSYCVGWLAAAACGSRLCFKSSALAAYAGEQFLDLYRDLMTE